MSIIAWLYFQNEQKLLSDLSRSNMQNVASKISSQIIFAHMSDSTFHPRTLNVYKEYKIGLFDKVGNKLAGDLDYKGALKVGFYHQDRQLLLIDNSTYGHLNVEYVLIQEQQLHTIIKELIIDILILFLVLYSLISLVGFYLAKLFLEPITAQRLKMDNFIKDTTHELNTPITALIMSTENPNFNSLKNIERIKLSAQRISEIYKDLTYLFLQTNNNPTPSSKLDLKAVLEEQIKFFEPLALKKKVTIESSLNSFEYAISKEHLLRLLNNLISNAIKYNKMGGKIKITLQNNQLIIEDTGIGIEKKSLDDIFKRFERSTTEQGGFGIGLSIVDDICKHYNIQIKVESTPNQGSNFTLIF